MTDSRVSVSHSTFALGLFLFLSTWLVFGRGFDSRPSSFEHWLNAKYKYQAPGANWSEKEVGAELEEGEQVRAFELIDGDLVEKPSVDLTVEEGK